MPPVEISSTPKSAKTAREFGNAGLVGDADQYAFDFGHGTHYCARSRTAPGLPDIFLDHNENVPYQVTLIPGDGIGPEVAQATVRAVEATGVRIAWECVELNRKVIEQSDFEIPQHVYDSLERTRIGLKGPVTTPIGGGYQSVNVQLRKKLDLFANVRPVRSFPGIKHALQRRQHRHGDLPREHRRSVLRARARSGHRRGDQPEGDHAHGVRAHRAVRLRLARRNGRKKVTAIHKANIMKLGDGLFLRCCREVAKDFPDIEYKELIVDNAAMQLVMRPETFDVLLLPNLYGDIVSDLAAGLVGGLGHRSRREHRREPRSVRSRARQRAGHRRKGHRESDGADAVGGPDADPPG